MILWGPDRIDELVDRLVMAMPADDLTADEVFTSCFEQPGVVFADDHGAVALGLGRSTDGGLVASVRLLIVGPDSGDIGHALLEVAEQWAAERDAARLELGGGLPFALWPGVDAASDLGTIAAARGYVEIDRFEAFGVPNTFRAAPPEGVEIRRARTDDELVAVTIAVAANWPHWSDEVARALEHGTCHMATEVDPEVGERVIGIGCHSVTRATWVGPFGVVPEHRRRRIGHALLGQICRDLMIAEFPIAEIPEVSSVEVESFLRTAGAEPVREYRRLVLELDQAR
jgi:GNAT superfamily N-acetyltransferase